MRREEYFLIRVESFIPDSTSGRHGLVHIRPCPGQIDFDPKLYVSCSKILSDQYGVGSIFEIKAKLSYKPGGTAYVYSNPSWPYRIIHEVRLSNK